MGFFSRINNQALTPSGLPFLVLVARVRRVGGCGAIATRPEAVAYGVIPEAEVVAKLRRAVIQVAAGGGQLAEAVVVATGADCQPPAPVSWLGADPDQGSVPPAGSAELVVTIDTTTPRTAGRTM
jgi:hypothetical protein